MPQHPIRLAPALALVLALGLPAPVAAQDGLAGAYLAARQAAGANDYRASADYFTSALIRDPSNLGLMEATIMAQMALGRIETAAPVARRLRESAPQSQVAELVLLADQLRREDYDAVIADYAAGRVSGPLVDGLVQGWAHLAQGRVTEALAAFDSVIATRALAPFGTYHKALALASVGDFEGAEALLSSEAATAVLRMRRGAIAQAEILGQLERYDEAAALLDSTFGPAPDPMLSALRAALAARDMPPFSPITTPADGLSEVFLSVAGALNSEAEDGYVLIYSRIAEALSQRNTEAILLSAALLERQAQYDLASEAYARIPQDSPAFYLAELGRAETLRSADRADEAVEVLEGLARSLPDLPEVQRTLGDHLRALERYDEAARAYDAAVALLPEADPSHWALYYVRGITHERGDRWELAEADFRKALELQPDQPQVLNYLGYSYLELQTNLEEALEMIERAVAARPDDGYIVDSLGWGLYRLGRYEEAVVHMERAAELMPVDPIVNDHLGDVYWAVGRRIEAEFQWRRALSFDPEDKDAERIRRKLEVGLDAVLIEEGGRPLRMANDNGG